MSDEPTAAPTADSVVDALDLERHPEGGFYRETWRSERVLELPDYEGARSAGTSILFLLPAGEVSRWHRVRSDELWLWHGGDELVLSVASSPDGEATEHVLGPTSPQAVVPAHQWQSATPRGQEHGYALCGCVVVPGFDFADFEMLEEGFDDMDTEPEDA